MNFLAHFHLAWPHPGLIAGGLEGDYYKGPVGDDLLPAIADGVVLHRAVDAFTDSHPIVAELRREFPDSLRRYAGILIDLSFDHYLTRNWTLYSALELTAFNEQAYSALDSHARDLSQGAQRMHLRLREYDILNCYHRWQNVTASASRIGERLRRGNPLRNVAPGLDPLRPSLEAAFLEFYPQLQRFSTDFQRQLN